MQQNFAPTLHVFILFSSKMLFFGLLPTNQDVSSIQGMTLRDTNRSLSHQSCFAKQKLADMLAIASNFWQLIKIHLHRMSCYCQQFLAIAKDPIAHNGQTWLLIANNIYLIAIANNFWPLLAIQLLVMSRNCQCLLTISIVKLGSQVSKTEYLRLYNPNTTTTHLQLLKIHYVQKQEILPPKNIFSLKIPQNPFLYGHLHSPASYSLNRPHLALFSLKTLSKRLLS